MNSKSSGRLVSIDALRGFDMFWIIGADMIFKIMSNLFGWEFLGNQLEHTKWNGFTFYDLIFPLFLFISGLSISFSIGKKIEKGENKGILIKQILKRTFTLILLGFIYNGLLHFNFDNFRYAGVLQRIALCYLFASLIVMYFSVRIQYFITVFILVGYWLLMMLFPAPGFNIGDLSMEGNLASYIDRLFLPGSFCCFEYGDNEGLFSTIPAIATTLLGVFTANFLRSDKKQNDKISKLLISGVIIILISILWNFLFPINKLLWSSSFVLLTAGLSILFLTFFYWIIDIKGYSKWAFPFIVIGMNPIIIYVVQGIFDFNIITNILTHGFTDYFGNYKLLFIAFFTLGVKWLFLYFLYRQKLFLKA